MEGQAGGGVGGVAVGGFSDLLEAVCEGVAVDIEVPRRLHVRATMFQEDEQGFAQGSTPVVRNKIAQGFAAGALKE